MAAIVAERLEKRYGTVQALRGVSLEVAEGECFGLIGPDGAGKTSLIRILATLLLPDQGRAELLGLDAVKDFRKLRLMLGYMPGRFSLYQDLSVEENLWLFARLFGTRVDTHYDLIRDIYVQLEPFKTRRAGALSGGMKQKLALCCALIHRPEILLLDEPTTGVDAVSRREFWEMLGRLRRHGITILVSTPYMDEAGRCDRVALIQEGQLLRVDTPQAIVDGYPWPLYAIGAPQMHHLLPVLRAYPHARSVFPFGESLHYADTRPGDHQPELQAYLLEAGFPDVQIRPAQAGIEDCFMDLQRTQADQLLT
ncbi:MAG: ABC transporter ATP-binding protein [Bacteroidia bacterium]|nr:ABC transporter ATP-binding protein [Bacteroidia bacterium]